MNAGTLVKEVTTEEVETQDTVLKSTEELKQEAERIVKRTTLYAAGTGLLPFPIIDAAILMGLQLNMIRSISSLYNIEFKENLVKSIIGSLAGSIGSVSLAKVIPGIGTVLGSLTTSVSAAATTYATGKVFTQHFDQGGTLLDFDPVKSREFFEKEFEAGRMFVSDVTKVEKEIEKEKKGFFGNLFSSKKEQEQENGEQQTEEGQEKVAEQQEKKGFINNLFSSKKKQKEEEERQELIKTNKELMDAVAELKAEIAAMKK